MKTRRRSLRNANQRSRSGPNAINTSLKRRNAPLPSMAWLELIAEVRFLHHRNEALHPAVLFTRAHGLDAQVAAIGGNAGVHFRIGDPSTTRRTSPLPRCK